MSSRINSKTIEHTEASICPTNLLLRSKNAFFFQRFQAWKECNIPNFLKGCNKNQTNVLRKISCKPRNSKFWKMGKSRIIFFLFRFLCVYNALRAWKIFQKRKKGRVSEIKEHNLRKKYINASSEISVISEKCLKLRKNVTKKFLKS